MPHWRDFKAIRLARRAWSEAELALLRSGRPVPTRTIIAYRSMRRKIGIIVGRPRRFADAPYEAPKPVPGKIPWPKWWNRAHAMRASGLGAYEIARLLKQDREAVRAALYPSVDAARKEKLRRLRARKRQDP